jgi:DNA invertase Pin-like site-specific DNA recombinase
MLVSVLCAAAARSHLIELDAIARLNWLRSCVMVVYSGGHHHRQIRSADALDARPGFAAMLEHIAGNGVRTIIVETANRFARDLVVQETGHRTLKGKGIEIVAADSPTALIDDTPTATFVRQVLGAVAQLDKAMTVAKLRDARERKRRLVRGWFPTPRQVP